MVPDSSSSPFGTISKEDFAKIAGLRRLALDEAEEIEPSALARLHEDMPKHFLEEYLPSLRIWVEGYDEDDYTKYNQAMPLTNAWGDWYRDAREEIMSR